MALLVVPELVCAQRSPAAHERRAAEDAAGATGDEPDTTADVRGTAPKLPCLLPFEEEGDPGFLHCRR